MRIIKWSIAFNLKIESLIAHVWIKLVHLQCCLFHNDVLFKMVRVVRKSLKLDEATSKTSLKMHLEIIVFMERTNCANSNGEHYWLEICVWKHTKILHTLLSFGAWYWKILLNRNPEDLKVKSLTFPSLKVKSQQSWLFQKIATNSQD